jgi:hypothetical protein
MRGVTKCGVEDVWNGASIGPLSTKVGVLIGYNDDVITLGIRKVFGC